MTFVATEYVVQIELIICINTNTINLLSPLSLESCSLCS